MESADENQPTAPEKISINIRGIEEEHAKALGDLVAAYVRKISRDIDLTGLDGLTIAQDFERALLDLDRGYNTTHKLTPSSGDVIGVAMTPAVIRNGIIKCHIVLNAGVILPLEDKDSECFGLALHVLAHECAHVEVTSRFDRAFPGTLLQKSCANAHDNIRWQVIMACWDEYAATWISAPYGAEPTGGYEQTFLNMLGSTRPKSNDQIRAYRLHGEHSRILAEVYGTYGDLMKFASYHGGNMVGRGLLLDDLPATREALDGHWFASYFSRLSILCEAIRVDYGKWKDTSKFEALGDLLDELVVEGGLTVTHSAGGKLYVDVPFKAETMPT